MSQTNTNPFPNVMNQSSVISSKLASLKITLPSANDMPNNPIPLVFGGRNIADARGMNFDIKCALTLTTNANINTQEVPILGVYNNGTKQTSIQNSGTLTVYYNTSMFNEILNLMQEYNYGLYFDMSIINLDPGSKAKDQQVVLKGCVLTSVSNPVQFDATSNNNMTQQMNFNYMFLVPKKRFEWVEDIISESV
jgi:hypothetical protein